MKMFAVVFALALAGSAIAQPTQAPLPSLSSATPSEADVLTFAYNLECLEGQFYSCAAFGTPLATAITGNGPAPSSCKKANLSSNVGTYAAELAREETAHVAFLYQALTSAGGSPRCPQVNIDTAFEAAAEAAFMTTTPLNPTFDPYANDVFFLHGSFIFEDLGASAYLGGLGLLTTPAYRQAAAQIGNAESYHSGIIRTLLYQIINTTPAYNSTVAQITTAITGALNSLTGTPQLRYSLVNNNGSSLANVDSQAFVPVATPAQVLKAVTLGAAAGNGGGFFPQNLVGNVKN
jgi:hypothetical protein